MDAPNAVLRLLDEDAQRLDNLALEQGDTTIAAALETRLGQVTRPS